MNSSITLIPIYKEKLSPIEEFSIEYSLNYLPTKRVIFICPERLNTQYYQEKFKISNFERYQNEFFESVPGYSRLLLTKDFYKQYSKNEFILILQTDAVLIKDNLNQWLNSKYDYIGAPWSEKFECMLKWDIHSTNNYQIKTSVGNGGLSLRRIKATIDLISEFPEAVDYFIKSKSSEDLFFSTCGMASDSFIIPNEIVASKFSMETNPTYYYGVNGNTVPFGGHAWWKYDPQFWITKFSDPYKALELVKQTYNIN